MATSSSSAATAPAGAGAAAISASASSSLLPSNSSFFCPGRTVSFKTFPKIKINSIASSSKTSKTTKMTALTGAKQTNHSVTTTKTIPPFNAPSRSSPTGPLTVGDDSKSAKGTANGTTIGYDVKVDVNPHADFHIRQTLEDMEKMIRLCNDGVSSLTLGDDMTAIRAFQQSLTFSKHVLGKQFQHQHQFQYREQHEQQTQQELEDNSRQDRGDTDESKLQEMEKMNTTTMERDMDHEKDYKAIPHKKRKLVVPARILTTTTTTTPTSIHGTDNGGSFLEAGPRLETNDGDHRVNGTSFSTDEVTAAPCMHLLLKLPSSTTTTNHHDTFLFEKVILLQNRLYSTSSFERRNELAMRSIVASTTFNMALLLHRAGMKSIMGNIMSQASHPTDINGTMSLFRQSEQLYGRVIELALRRHQPQHAPQKHQKHKDQPTTGDEDNPLPLQDGPSTLLLTLIAASNNLAVLIDTVGDQLLLEGSTLLASTSSSKPALAGAKTDGEHHDRRQQILHSTMIYLIDAKIRMFTMVLQHLHHRKQSCWAVLSSSTSSTSTTRTTSVLPQLSSGSAAVAAPQSTTVVEWNGCIRNLYGAIDHLQQKRLGLYSSSSSSSASQMGTTSGPSIHGRTGATAMMSSSANSYQHHEYYDGDVDDAEGDNEDDDDGDDVDRNSPGSDFHGDDPNGNERKSSGSWSNGCAAEGDSALNQGGRKKRKL